MQRLPTYSGRRVLVTGATGFIGGNLCRRLCERGAELHAVSRQHVEERADGIRWWNGDMAESERVAQIVKSTQPDIIFHLASRVEGTREAAVVLPILQSNLVSAVNVLSAAVEFGCRRVVLTGSLEEPVEVDPHQVPSSPYAAAKWAASGYARMFRELYQLSVLTLRVFMVYGPGQQDLKKLVPYVILSLLRGEAAKLTSGKRNVDWIFVDDVVEAFLAAGLSAETGTLDVGSGELVNIREVVERLVREINPRIQPIFGTIPDRPLEQVRVADVALTTQRLGWRPTTSLELGLRETVKWYAARIDANV